MITNATCMYHVTIQNAHLSVVATYSNNDIACLLYFDILM